tara:strand:- start:1823 stop:3463 length:1641 start_codon:yes stop_codon:yes gene_type:complete
MAQQIPFSFLGQGETFATVGLFFMDQTNVQSTNFDTGAEVTSEGGTPVTDTGICWSTNPNPTKADNFKSSGSGGLGAFTVDILDGEGLLNETTYYFRAYATNLYGEGYSSTFIKTSSYVPFITEWTTAVPNHTIELLKQLGTAPYINIDAWIDWGDGSALENISGTSSTLANNMNHEYVSAGTYEVKISGDFSCPKMRDQDELIEIKQWGTQPWKSLASAFRGADQMNCVALDVPVFNVTELNLRSGLNNMFRRGSGTGGPFTGNPTFSSWDVSGILDLSFMFNASSFNQDITSWDVSSCTEFDYMFRYCPSFNQDISSWDVSSGEDFQNMFQGASSFNFDLDSWNMSNADSISGMFSATNATNLTLGSWDLSSCDNLSNVFNGASFIPPGITSWDVSNATSFTNMFLLVTASIPDITGWNVSSATNIGDMFNLSNFNQDITGWNVSNVTNFGSLFKNNTAINQDFSTWDISNATSLWLMFDNVTTLSTANYDAMLIAWEALGPPINLSTHFGTTQYTKAPSAAATAHASLLSTYNWTIIDGGPTP